MPTTVKRILELECLKEARLLAGAEGLQRRITSVTVGEVPDIADWLSGGEMVLSTLFAARGDVEKQRDFYRRVMLSGAAALFIKTTRFVGDIPGDVIDLANKRGFPIVEVPQGLRWTRLMQDATEVIINRQASQLERSQAIHSSLLGVVVKGGGWQELAEEASRLLEAPVLFLDTSLEILSAADVSNRNEVQDALLRPEVRQSVEAAAQANQVFRVECDEISPFSVLPVVTRRQTQGYICAFTSSAELSPLEMMVLEHSVTIASLEVAQDRARLETEVRLRGDFVDQVISGGDLPADSLLRRGAFLGCDLSQGATVILLGEDDYNSLASVRTADQEHLDGGIERFFTRCSRYIAAAETSSLVSLKSGEVIVFLCGKSAHDKEVATRIARTLQGFSADMSGLSISVGVGNFVPGLGQMQRGYREASVALKVGRKLTGRGAFMHFADVGSYRLLLAAGEQDPGQVRTLYEETVGPVDRYDQVNGTHLVQTLTTFFDNDENLTKTAANLYAHRHTVRYRLEKIEELTGLSVFKTEHKERLSLGLKARSLLLG